MLLHEWLHLLSDSVGYCQMLCLLWTLHVAVVDAEVSVVEMSAVIGTAGLASTDVKALTV